MQNLIKSVKRAPSITDASKMIGDAGISDEYLAHCLLYESEAMAWAAKNQRSR